ncbi:MAG: hypothetical protein JWO15_1048 [Sphingomonadales bacterium]|nr:hypothetical protein [Sphingomonadales bacterium]
MPFPPNPDFGTGAARRVIRLAKPEDGIVEGHLVDNYHEMRIRLRHADGVITGCEGDMIRFPTTLCPGAALVVRELIGMRLDADLNDRMRMRRNCTHLYDLAALAAQHARRPQTARIYEAIVPDDSGLPVTISVTCDDAIVHAWTTLAGQIIAPQSLKGLPLLRGFTRWASAMLTGDALEAAMILGKTCFIATVRPFAPESSAGQPVRENVAMVGACYAYAPERMATARYTDQIGERLGGHI